MKILNSKITPGIMSSCPNSKENYEKIEFKASEIESRSPGRSIDFKTLILNLIYI